MSEISIKKSDLSIYKRPFLIKNPDVKSGSKYYKIKIRLCRDMKKY